MDLPRSTSANIDDNVGIPEDLRCKRSDGKQWRCSALSMPDKTVCEKHYIQAKKRAANSALRASLKKAKRKSTDESDTYVESKKDELDIPLVNTKGGQEFPATTPGKKSKEKVPKGQSLYSPETITVRSSVRHPHRSNDDSQRDIAQRDDNRTKSTYKSQPSAVASSRNKNQKNFIGRDLAEHSGKSTDSSGEAGGQTCHQCRRSDRGRVIWCSTCERKSYCNGCISKWYPDIPEEEIQRLCPACRGICNCRVCLNGDNLIKARIREIAASDRLQYLHYLLCLVLPVLKQIHSEHCFELEVEAKVQGFKPDIPRSKLLTDEQIYCDCCRMPIIDYHRHCANCSYDLCLTCCRDLRQVCQAGDKGEPPEVQGAVRGQDGAVVMKQLKSSLVSTSEDHLARSTDKGVMDSSRLFSGWKANNDGSIPCPPKEFGGCGCQSLPLWRIFKMNWVGKLEKIAEEMVSGCRVYELEGLGICPSCLGSRITETGSFSDSKLCQSAHREDSTDNFLYCPSSQDIKFEGFGHFQKHWVRGEPIVVKHIFDHAFTSSWDPLVIWRGIRETADEKFKGDDRVVKAIDCLNWSEVDIELGQFFKGYSEGRIHENGWPEMLKLKDWPPLGPLEDFLLYQRAEFISTLPLLEYIHSKWGLLNLAAKLPNEYPRTNLSPKIFIAYGTHEELGRGDSVTNLHVNMGDAVYLLMHASEVKFQGWQRVKIEKLQRTFREADAKETLGDSLKVESKTSLDEMGKSPDLSTNEHRKQNEISSGLDINATEVMEYQLCDRIQTDSAERKDIGSSHAARSSVNDETEKAHAGVLWDIFRRQDVSKLNEYLKVHRTEFRNLANLPIDSVARPVYDQFVFLNEDHKRKLKEKFKVEPWTIEQRVGEAVFIPAGCPCQARNLQSCVQLGLDFLSPESLGESMRLMQEICHLPNGHKAKQQVLEVGKMTLYAASSAIREIQKLSLDPRVAADLGVEGQNLTDLVSENLEKLTKRWQITCI